MNDEYDVVWSTRALNDLAALWTELEDRAAVTLAATGLHSPHR